MPRTTRASATRDAGLKAKPQQLSSPPATPVATSKTKRKNASIKAESTPDSRTRHGGSKHSVIKKEESAEDDELPHNLGKIASAELGDGTDAGGSEPPKKRAKLAGNGKKLEPVDGDAKKTAVKSEATEMEESPKKTPKKKENYGLTPGITPFPDYPRPTHEECHEVVRLLEKVHGKVNAPKAIPPPSLNVAGCGEVPSVLDALVRTRLSANTTNKNSSTAFQGLVSRFGTLKEGIGKGSVDWDAVRRAPQREVYKAIERGGLADRKSRDIQAILQIAYEEGQERKAAFANPNDAPTGADHEPEKEKEAEITKAQQNVLSLDHLHLLSTDDAINKMLTFPGIGPKTASCVALFCLQRPSFAVDTHVFRLCQYLGWVPKSTKKGQPKVDRNTTYSHCDVRIPDELKYPLHTLLIKHGKACPRCRAITGQSSAGWEEGCPIEHLVKRHGSKKGGISVAARKRAAEAAGGDQNGEQDSDLSDVPDNEE